MERNLISTQHINNILNECEDQGVTDSEGVARFAAAYAVAYTALRIDVLRCVSQPANAMNDVVLNLATLVEPENNLKTRNVPVTFKSCKTAIPHSHISRALNDLFCAILDGDITPEKAYQEFQEIHPFKNGNGRVGHVLWAAIKREQDGEWPCEMPPAFAV